MTRIIVLADNDVSQCVHNYMYVDNSRDSHHTSIMYQSDDTIVQFIILNLLLTNNKIPHKYKRPAGRI